MNAVANGAMASGAGEKSGYSGIWAPWAPGAIGAMVLGFVVFWPVGLAVLSYNLWGTWWSSETGRWKSSGMRGCGKRTPWGRSSRSGNTAFDAYKLETIKRLEQEERDFATYIDELRAAKDRDEFDRFMNARMTKEPRREPGRGSNDDGQNGPTGPGASGY